MVDYSINSDFDVHFNEWNDFATVDGLKEFEQDVVITLHDEMSDIIQYGFTQTAKQKIKLAVNRTADKYNVINTIQRVEIREPIGKPETFEVKIDYTTGDTFAELF